MNALRFDDPVFVAALVAAGAGVLAVVMSCIAFVRAGASAAAARDEAARGRAQSASLDAALRRDVAAELRAGLHEAFAQVTQAHAGMRDTVGALGENLRRALHDNEQAASAFRGQLLLDTASAIDSSREKTSATLKMFGDAQGERLAAQGQRFDGFAQQLRSEQEALREKVGVQLEAIRADSAAKLEAMRAAVDEKLQSALEARIGESFSRVSEQFVAVQQAVGEVRQVAGQVGDLRRLFSNVSARGGWGEAQLGSLLEDVASDCFERNVRLRDPGSDKGGEMVEFALRVAQRDAEPLLMAIDAKFPTEDFERMLIAAEAGDRDGEALAQKGLERRIKLEAERIGGKYIVPPRTTEFAVLYLPTDSLFVAVSRIPGLIEHARQVSRVMVLGPGLLPALLHTIRVGHKTLTLERRAEEIMETLSAVKSEWGKMGAALDTLGKRAATLSNGIDDVQRRARAVGRTLRGLEAIEGPRADIVLGLTEETLALEMVED